MSIALVPEQAALSPELNVKDFLNIIKRRKAIFIQVFGLVLTVGILATALSKPIYQTYAKLLVPAGSSQVSIVDSNNPIATMLAAAQPDSVSTQVQVLQSGPFLAEAERQAGIMPKPQVIPPSTRFEALEGTNVIQITVEGGDPQDIARLANTIVDLHLQRTDLLTTTGLRETIEFVHNEGSKAAKNLADAEKKLVAFRQAHSLVGLSSEREARAGEYAALLARVLELESNIGTAQWQIANLRARLKQEPSELVLETVRENPRIAKIQDKLDDLKFQRMDLLRDFKPTSRQIQDLDKQITRLQQKLSEEPREIRVRTHSQNPARGPLGARLTEVEAALQGYQQNHNAARAQFSAKKEILDSLGPWEAELSRLTRDRDALQASSTMLSDRLRDLEIRAGARLRTARAIERAAVPTNPIQPQKAKDIALSAFLALLLAAGTVFLQEYLDDRVNSPEEWERISALPTLGHVPLMGTKQEHLVAALPANCQVAEAYRSLRSSIGFAAIDSPVRRLQITSPSKGDGKTTTAVNLATAMARDGKKVILVDADLRWPSVHRLLHLPNSRGLSELLAGTESVNDSLQATQINNLLVVPAGAVPPNPAELLGSPVFDRILEELGEWADVVIFDSAPCLPVTDSVIVAARMDGVVLVVLAGQTRKAAIKQTVELLGRARARVLGVLLNQVTPDGSGYYYYSYRPYSGEDDDNHAGPRGGRHRRNGKGARPELENGRILTASLRGTNDGEA